MIPSMTTDVTPKLLATQWLQPYHFALTRVAPLVLIGASSNAILAYLTASLTHHISHFYTIAAIATVSIIPYATLHMEPRFNGTGE